MRLVSIPFLRMTELLRLTRAGLMGTAMLLTADLATTSEAHAQTIQSIHSHRSPLSGLPRIPSFQQPSAFPYYGNAFPNTYSGRYFGNYWGSYLNYGLNSFQPFFYNQFNSRPNNSLYYNRGGSSSGRNTSRSEGSAYGRNSGSQSSHSVQRGGACCNIKSGTEQIHNDGTVECKLEYPVPLTPEQKSAQELLYKDVVKSLVRNGYHRVTENGVQINAPEHLLHYLTPIVIAHDLLNDETIGAIQAGLEKGNSRLIETYGSARFFHDAIRIIEFHKARNVELDGVEASTLKRDIEVTMRILTKIEADISETEEKETGMDSSFTIEDKPAKAEFIARAYHRLDTEKLEMIRDAVSKAANPDVAVREQITAEQRLYLEQLMYMYNGELHVVGPRFFSRCISKLNDYYSEKPDKIKLLKVLDD